MKTLFTLAIVFIAISSNSQIPTDNLILYLPFEGSADDESGNELNGIVEGAELTEDRFGLEDKAYSFDGISDYISIPEDPLMNVEFPFTVSLWYYREETPDGIEMLFKSDANDHTYSGFWINMAATGQVVAAYGDGDGFGAGHRISKKSTDAPANGEWHHVLAVYHGLIDIDLYIDCVLDPGSYSGGANNMAYLGENSSIGRYDWRIFEGEIDNIRVYSDAITPEEVLTFCEEEPCVETIYKIDTVTYHDTITYVDTLIHYDTLTYYDIQIYYDTIVHVDTITYYDTVYVQMTGINESQLETIPIKLYPNPTSDILTIEFGENYSYLEDYTFTIIDELGREVYNNKIIHEKHFVDLLSLGLSNGTYYFQILDGNSYVQKAQKFVLNK
ncbi:LamG-like jellyroll fold domain-containing protein [Crocinitomix algicola]|uniref:LamG-like jellyroll fold domain-containing protein n=1 Tax=Crocinitomix algicola TaxID=1740263 RepID=UPI000832962A|nr:LamG-like jellyroll fold domain-containing protein [Crocinitomix algicola]